MVLPASPVVVGCGSVSSCFGRLGHGAFLMLGCCSWFDVRLLWDLLWSNCNLSGTIYQGGILHKYIVPNMSILYIVPDSMLCYNFKEEVNEWRFQKPSKGQSPNT